MEYPVTVIVLAFVLTLANSHPLITTPGDGSLESDLNFNQLSCPDLTTCAQDDTCCSTGGDTFGCCPKANAVCCNDLEHCCPEGYTCDIEKGNCIQMDISLSSISETVPFQETPSLNEAEVHVVRCSDNVSVCEDKHTCCPLKGRTGFGCCEGTKAVCCEDHQHCCPENSTCDIKKGVCTKISSVSLVKTYSGEPTPLTPKNVVCPDGKTQCPNQNTCCELVTGTYGCCSLPEAACCADNKFCCPNGYSCDPNSDKCKPGEATFPDLTKDPALSHLVPLELKKLCGGDTVCGSNDTCCKHPDESWACCPSVDAVCCSDGRYCCPHNYTCNMIDNTCELNDEHLIKIQTKHLMQTKITLGSNINQRYDALVNTATNFCPGDRYDCKDNQTCCLLLTGAYGCCNGKKAVCCPDKQHCCPAGYKCSDNGECLEVTGFIDMEDLL